MRTKIFIFDVNTLVSAFIVGSDTNARAFSQALKIGAVVYTHDIWAELTDVFLRKKFDRYHPFEERADFLSLLESQTLLWPKPTGSINACRDPKDDKYLELAVSCKASCIITGDNDLLVLSPFRDIPILHLQNF